MVKIEKIQDEKIFSSDMNQGRLVCSTLDGRIVLGDDNSVLCDKSKKYIKFYPPDCSVFTTTDTSGLRIWDSEKMDVVYSYKKEDLNDHSYSNSCIVASYDDFNLKFYDLRSRFMINSKVLPKISKIDWHDDLVICISEDKLKILDFKNMMNNLFSIDDVKDTVSCESVFYYLTNSNELNACNIQENKQITKIKKHSNYNKIQSADKRKYLIGITENGFRIENFDGFSQISLGDVKIKQVHINDQNGFVISDTEIYKLTDFKLL